MVLTAAAHAERADADRMDGLVERRISEAKLEALSDKLKAFKATEIENAEDAKWAAEKRRMEREREQYRFHREHKEWEEQRDNPDAAPQKQAASNDPDNLSPEQKQGLDYFDHRAGIDNRELYERHILNLMNSRTFGSEEEKTAFEARLRQVMENMLLAEATKV